MMHSHNTKKIKLTQLKFNLSSVAGTALIVLATMLYPGTGVTGGDCALVSGCAFMEGDTYSEQSENIIVFESTGEYISFREYASDIGWGLIPDEKSAGTWSCSDNTLTMTSAGVGQPVIAEGQLSLDALFYSESGAPDIYKLEFSKDLFYIIRTIYSRRTGEVCGHPSIESKLSQEQGSRQADASTLQATGSDEGEGADLDQAPAAPQQIPDAEMAVVYSSDADIFDRLGYAVSLSDDGNVLAVGAPFDLERRRPAPMDQMHNTVPSALPGL